MFVLACLLIVLLLPPADLIAAPLGVRVLSQAKPAVDFVLKDSRGDKHRLSQYRGSVVIVNFWATWCVPCREEMPSLQRAWQRLGEDKVVVLAASMDESWSAVREFLDRTELGFPVLLDRDGEVAAQWRVLGVPTAYVVDSEGMRRIRIIGGYDWEDPQLLEEIRRLLPAEAGH